MKLKIEDITISQETSDKNYVRMQDLVREMCLWFTLREFDNKFCPYHRGDYNSTSSITASRLFVEINVSSRERTLPNDLIPGPSLRSLLCKGFSIEEEIV